MFREHTSLTLTQKKNISADHPIFPPSFWLSKDFAQTPDRRRTYDREAEEGAVGVDLRGVSFHPTQHP